MIQKLSNKAIVDNLHTQIVNASKNFFGEEREPTVQIITWIKGQTEKELDSVFDDTYLVLQKRSNKDIVFPSGSIEKYEIDGKNPNPQGIILAWSREFKEELHKLLTIDFDNIIDVYPYYAFETAKNKKYIQFRLLACLSPLLVENIEEKFAKTLVHMPLDQQEHDACYVKSYEEIIKDHMSDKHRLKESTNLSLEYHRLMRKTIGRYGS